MVSAPGVWYHSLVPHNPFPRRARAVLDGIREWLSEVDWQALLEQVSNDRLVALFSHPYGLAALGALMLLALFMKWRITFVVVAAGLAVGFLARYTVVGAQGGPNRSLFLFAGAAVAVGAFIIYFLFIRED